MKKIRTLLSKYLTQYLTQCLTYTLVCGLALILSGCANETTAASGGDSRRDNSSTGSITLTRSQIALPTPYLNFIDNTNSDGSVTNFISGPSFTLTGLIASKTPATANVTYSSSNTSLVTVDDSGTLSVVANPSSSTNVTVTLSLQGFDNAAATTELTVSFSNSSTSANNFMVYLSESAELVSDNDSDSCKVTLNVLAMPYSGGGGFGLGYFVAFNNANNSLTTLGRYGFASDGSIGVDSTNITDSNFTNNNFLFSVKENPRFGPGTKANGVYNNAIVGVPRIQHLSVEIIDSGSNNFYYLTSDIQGTVNATPEERTKQAYNYQCQTQPVSGS